MLYAVKSANRELLANLILKGWDVSVKNQKGENLMHVGCSSEHSGVKGCLQLILDHLSDEDSFEYVNALDCEEKTPLHHASIRGQKEIVLLLLKKGANLAVHDKYGKTPLHYAVSNER